MRPASQVLVALVVAVVQSGGVACGQEERPHPGGLSASQLAREGSGLSPEEAAELESHLETRPDDLATRARLLGYYFGSVREGSTSLRVSGSTTTIEARRRHILWIIRNHPEAETWDLAERLLKKAQELEPNAGWSMLLEQLGQRLEASSPGLESVPSSSSASPKLGSSGGWVHRIAPPRDAFLAAQRAGAQGRVTVGVTIERDGTVSEVELIEPVHPVLDDAVLTAVRQWRHESVKIRTSTQVSFTLDRPRQARPSGSEAELKFSAGMRFFRADRTAEALEAFRGVLAIDPRHGLAHYMLGRALINTGDFLAAREHLERFLELAPDDPEVRVAREMLESLG